VHALKVVTESEDVAKLQKARYFSVLLDETNDISCAKNLMLYCQFLDRENNKKDFEFMKLLALKECDADLIFKSVVEYFHEIDVSINKIIIH